MVEHAVDVFFYGSYINFDVLKEVNIRKRAFAVGRINGYVLTIAPLANLSFSQPGSAYGIITKLTHAEMDRLYHDHAKIKLGGEYFPEAVIVYQLNGMYTPALCYISHNMPAADADPAYVERILRPTKEYGFPKWYLDHIESFK